VNIDKRSAPHPGGIKSEWWARSDRNGWAASSESAIKKCRNDLFVFMTRRDVPTTNNGSGRAQRMSVIFRKVTECFRSVWGAKLYAATVSVIATGKLHGKSALEAIAEIVTPPTVLARAA